MCKSPLSISRNGVASTITSEVPPTPLIIGGKRKLHFAPKISEVVCSVPCVRDLTYDEKRAVFWTPSEFKGIRLSAKLITREIRKDAQQEIAELDDAFATALRLCNMTDSDLDTLLKSPSGHTESLQVWCSGRNNGRGLERYVSTIHRFKRAEYANEARAAVLRMCRSDQISSDQLASFYAEYAKSASVYSRLIGHADHIASLDTCKPEQQISLEPRKLAEKRLLVDRREHLKSSPSKRGLLLVRQISQRMETAV
jgi:hypothetical protein